MQTLTSDNKLKDLTSECKVKFNVPMHGVKKGQEVKYSSAGSKLQTNIRRRLADNDNSVEIVNSTQKQPKTEKAESTGKASIKNQKGDS